MSADELRKAAETLRERAEAEAILRDGDPYYAREFLPNGEWVSEASAWDVTMHPGVGLALADLLVGAAQRDDDEMSDLWAPLARLINGGAS